MEGNISKRMRYIVFQDKEMLGVYMDYAMETKRGKNFEKYHLWIDTDGYVKIKRKNEPTSNSHT